MGWMNARAGLLALFVLTSAVSGRAGEHEGWQALLSKHVYVQQEGRVSVVNYAGLAADRALLSAYLQGLTKVTSGEFAGWPPERQLAFLINAYNAWTVELILRHYPEIDSIRDIGGWFRSPWRQKFFELLGQRRSLDELEHSLIRKQFNEPRIHFAVNCASVGCPALAQQAYRAEQLDAQLEQATRRFLADRGRNGVAEGQLRVSPIFNWYRDDFERGWRKLDSLAAFLAHYAEPLGLSAGQREALLAGQLDIRFGDYDWSLNDAD